MRHVRPLPAVLALCFSVSAPLPGLAATLLPDFGAATFQPGAAIDNPYFPLRPGQTSSLRAQGVSPDGEPFDERTELSVAGTGPTILGVETTTQLDSAYENGLLVERTYDYFAEDASGNVWYFGEDVTNYVYDDDGNLIETNTASSWRAGVNDALPGYIMAADPFIGLAYFQEFAAADGALDEAVIFALDQTLTIGDRVFDDVLVTFESTSLDPAARELKYYAPGVGLIRIEEGVDAAFLNPAKTFNLAAPSPIPAPAGLPLLAAALGALAVARRRARSR